MLIIIKQSTYNKLFHKIKQMLLIICLLVQLNIYLTGMYDYKNVIW